MWLRGLTIHLTSCLLRDILKRPDWLLQNLVPRTARHQRALPHRVHQAWTTEVAQEPLFMVLHMHTELNEFRIRQHDRALAETLVTT